MWNYGWRDRVWSALDTEWDLIVIGGGITGAGIFREATRAGLKTLLVEAQDFAAGTSSRSSKLVHGGFRYLKNGQLKLTSRSVRERQRLLKEGRGLVNSLGFLMPSYRSDRIPTILMGAALTFYDLLALKRSHRHYDALDMLALCPLLTEEGLRGGYRFFDAQTDDARLVLRLIRESVRDGGLALNYAQVSDLLQDQNGNICGIALTDNAPLVQSNVLSPCSRTLELKSKIVINATGAWADNIRDYIGYHPRLRKLRGSHLVLPYNRLPLTRAVSLWHSRDNRPVFAFPWEGVILVGTTDIDHEQPLSNDPYITAYEVEYLMTALNQAFPDQELGLNDIQASFSGIRPVINTGKADPSKESREHILWQENGLLTVSGGKLTTFRLMAHGALKYISNTLSKNIAFDSRSRVLDAAPSEVIVQVELKAKHIQRLLGRYGADIKDLIECAKSGELTPIEDTSSLWAELRWAANSEGVVHLSDLLLRRVRLGLTLPAGGVPILDKIRSIVQPELKWGDKRWENEVQAYINHWNQYYHLGT